MTNKLNKLHAYTDACNKLNIVKKQLDENNMLHTTNISKTLQRIISELDTLGNRRIIHKCVIMRDLAKYTVTRS